MIPQQTLENYPVFGDNATKVQPDSAKMAAGFQQADVLPAEWMNWAWNKNSKGIREANQGLTSIEAELNNVVTAGGLTPAEETNNQILTAINGLIAAAEARAKLAAHPVGSLYWTSSTEDPAVTFGGGTWTQIKDKFILAAGDTYANGATGGAATVTLTTAQLPSHTHSIGGSTGSTQPTFTGGSHSHGAGSISVPNHEHTIYVSNIFNERNNNTYINIAVGNSAANAEANMRTPSRYGGQRFSQAVSGAYYYRMMQGDSGQNISNYNYTYTSGNTTGWSGACSGNTADASTGGTVGSHSHTLPANTGSAGSGNAVNILPPYVVKFCWERTA